MHNKDRTNLRGALATLLLLTAGVGNAQVLTWGVDGTGGSGTWSASATNWWNGASNQAWTAGATARFDGTPGTVAVDGQQTVGGLVFATSPVILAPGAGSRGIRPSQPVFTIDVQSGEATLDVEVSGIYTSGDSLRKVGSGKATLMRDADFFDEILVLKGELAARDDFDSFAADRLYLANDPSVVVTVGPFNRSFGGKLPSLDGGGPLGGVIRPAPDAGTVPINVDGNATVFAGSLQDNTGSTLRVEFSSFFGAQTLTAENPYTGPTWISQSKGLILSGYGSLPFSPISVMNGSQLVLDSATTVRHDRVSNLLPMTMANGTLRLIGHPSVPVTEVIGPLQLGGASRIQVEQTVARTTVVLTELHRSVSDTLDASGSGTVKVLGLANSATGIVGPWLTMGTTTWATVNMDQELVPFSAYQTLLAGASPTSHVSLASPSEPFPSATMATLTLGNTNPTETVYVLDTDGTLTLSQGGLLVHGAGPLRIEGGTIATPAEPLFLSAHQDFTIESAIAGAGLVKTGPAAVALTGMNSYTGDTYVAGGSLHVGDDRHLGAGERVFLGGGQLIAEQNFASSKILAARPTSSVGATYLNDHTIDVGIHDVEFAAAEGTLYKIGTGRMTITTGAIGWFYLREGTLVLNGADGGGVSMDGGDLNATGRLDSIHSLNFDNPIVPWHLSVGDGIGSLAIDSLNFSGRVKVHLDLGASESDHLHLQGGIRLWPPGDAMVLTFRDAGGLALEQPYPILSSSRTWPLDPAAFIVDPNQHFAGWDVSLSIVTDASSHHLLATIHSVGSEVVGDQAPDQLRVVAADPTRLTLAWNDNTDLETGYELERADSTFGGFNRIAILPPDATLFQDTGLLPYMTYRYRVRAVSHVGATSYSNELGAETVSSLFTWRMLLFNQTSSWSGPGADANDLDADFLPNLLEFALGTSPFLADAGRAPVARLVENPDGTRSFGLEFIRPKGLTGVAYYLESATVPHGIWSWIQAPRIAVTDLGDGTEQVILSNPTPLSAESPDSGQLRLTVN